MNADDLELHYQTVINAFKDRRVIPFLGAGVNLCDRPLDSAWKPGDNFLPNGHELTEFLVTTFPYPPGQPQDLLRVSQFASVIPGSGPLYKALHGIFKAEYPAWKGGGHG